MFSKILDAIRERSTCHRLKVGALIVRHGRTISSGWNGVRKGGIHCSEHFKGIDPESDIFRSAHALFSEKYEIHAEQNAIAYAARNGIATDGSTLYTSLAPCAACAKLIVAAGIKEVFYRDLYDRSNDGILFLNDAGVNARCMD